MNYGLYKLCYEEKHSTTYILGFLEDVALIILWPCHCDH